MSHPPFPPAPEETVFTLLPTSGGAEPLVQRLAGHFRIHVGEPVEQREVFLDTPDWLLHRARMTLARRAPGGSLDGRAGQLHLTAEGAPEQRSPARGKLGFAWELPEGALRDAVRRVATVRRLAPRVELRTRTTPLELLDEREKIVVRARIVEGHARVPGEPEAQEHPLPTTLQVSPLRGYEGERAELLDVLRDDPQLSPDDARGLALALRTLGCDPGAQRLGWRVELESAAPAGLEVRRVLQRFLEVLRANEEGLLADVDTEFLHDFRVAIRRTRSILSNCKQVLAPDELEHFRDEFVWLGQITSRVRDLDVFLLAAHGRAGDLAGSDPSDLKPLQRRLASERRATWKRMAAALRSSRYHYAVESWAAFLEQPSGADPEGARRPLIEFASKRIARQHRRVLKGGARVGADSPDGELHALRIECKKLRYLLDAFGALFPVQPVARLVKRLKQLQEALGDYNDAGVQRAMLHEIAQELQGAPPATLLTIGRALERLARRADELRPQILERVEVFAREEDRDTVRQLVRSARA